METLLKIGQWQAFEQSARDAVAQDDPIGLLLAEHEWLRSIASAADAAVRAGASLDAEAQREQQSRVRSFIEAHIRKEEEVFFPAVDRLFVAKFGRMRSEAMLGEHDAIRVRYVRLQRVLDRGTNTGEPFRHMWRALTVHFANEEQHIYDAARPLLTPELRRDLVVNLMAFEPTQGAPGARTSTYARTHRLKGQMLSFLLGVEDTDLYEKAATSKSGRAAKTLVKQGPLRITIVAMRQGAALQSHHVAGPVSIQAIRGRLRLTTHTGDIDVPAGGLVSLAGGEVHSAIALDDSAIVITFAEPRPTETPS